MFDISFWELALVFVIALLVLGPKEIPKIAFMAGQWLNYFRNRYYAISAELKQQMQQEFEEKNKDNQEKTKSE